MPTAAAGSRARYDVAAAVWAAIDRAIPRNVSPRKSTVRAGVAKEWTHMRDLQVEGGNARLEEADPELGRREIEYLDADEGDAKADRQRGQPSHGKQVGCGMPRSGEVGPTRDEVHRV